MVSNFEFAHIFKITLLCKPFLHVFGNLNGVKSEVLLYIENALPDSSSIQNTARLLDAPGIPG